MTEATPIRPRWAALMSSAALPALLAPWAPATGRGSEMRNYGRFFTMKPDCYENGGMTMTMTMMMHA